MVDLPKNTFITKSIVGFRL